MAAQELAEQQFNQASKGIKGYLMKFFKWLWAKIKGMYNTVADIMFPNRKKHPFKEKLAKEYNRTRDVIKAVELDGPTQELTHQGPMTWQEAITFINKEKALGHKMALTSIYNIDSNNPKLMLKMLGIDGKNGIKGNLNQRELDKLIKLTSEIEKCNKDLIDTEKKLHNGSIDLENISKKEEELRAKKHILQLEFEKKFNLAYGKMNMEKAFYVYGNARWEDSMEKNYQKILEGREPDNMIGFNEQLKDTHSLLTVKPDEASREELLNKVLDKDKVFKDIQSGAVGMEVFNQKCSIGTMNIEDITKDGNYFVGLLSEKDVQAMIMNGELNKAGLKYCIFRNENDYNPQNIDLRKAGAEGKNVNKILQQEGGRYKVFIPIDDKEALKHLNSFSEAYGNTRKSLKVRDQINAAGGIWAKPFYRVKDHKMIFANSGKKEIANAPISNFKSMSGEEFKKLDGYITMDNLQGMGLSIDNYTYYNANGERKDLNNVDIDALSKEIRRDEQTRTYQKDLEGHIDFIYSVEERAKRGITETDIGNTNDTKKEKDESLNLDKDTSEKGKDPFEKSEDKDFGNQEFLDQEPLYNGMDEEQDDPSGETYEDRNPEDPVKDPNDIFGTKTKETTKTTTFDENGVPIKTQTEEHTRE